MREGFLKNEPPLLPTKKGIVPAASALLPLEGLSFLESYTACVPSSVRDLPLMQLLLQKKQERTIGGAKDLSDALAPFRQRCTLPDTELLALL